MSYFSADDSPAAHSPRPFPRLAERSDSPHLRSSLYSHEATYFGWRVENLGCCGELVTMTSTHDHAVGMSVDCVTSIVLITVSSFLPLFCPATCCARIHAGIAGRDLCAQYRSEWGEFGLGVTLGTSSAPESTRRFFSKIDFCIGRLRYSTNFASS